MSDTPKGVTFQITTVAKGPYTDREYVKITLPRFGGGSAQDWLQWSHEFLHLSKLKKWTPQEKDLHLRLILDNEAPAAWERASDSKELTSATVFAKVYAAWGKMYVPANYNEQLEEELFMFGKRRSETVLQCNQRMRELTRMMAKLPVNSMALDEKSMVRYFKRAMPDDWTTAFEKSGVNFSTMAQAVQYFERLEQSERRQNKTYKSRQKAGKQNNQGGNNNGGRGDNRNGGRGNDNKGNNHDGQNTPEQSSNMSNSGKWCTLHKTASHIDSECFAQKPKPNTGRNQKASAKKTEKAKLTKVADSDSEYDYSDDDGEGKVIPKILSGPVSKQEKPMRLRMRLSKTKEQRVALVDTGCSVSYVDTSLVAANAKLGFNITPSSTVFEQVDGRINADGNMVVKFRFMDLNYGSHITHPFAVINDTKDDVVIGRDLLSARGIIVNFRDGPSSRTETPWQLTPARNRR